MFKFIAKSEPVLAEGATSREKMNLNTKSAKLWLQYIAESQEELVAEAETAKEAWTLLEEIYEPKSRARIAQLRSEFYSIKKQLNKVRTILLAEEGRILSKQGKEIDNSKVLVTEGKTFGALKKKKAKVCSYCKKFELLPSECRLKSTKNHSLKDKTPLAYSSQMSAIYASALYADFDETEWTIDTAATDHFCNKKELFQDYKELNKSAAL
ncbi:hypothetical protein AVEN_163513-1 [Araneus ventricosus]|uniref:Uncharacterized protein n=1 Tax=Araneus ventricosus TaxID=182803 RepID=A0A4Y2BR63_ARAVE|nr:hypothetical protein AVEN_163513-1 [Araneus ventricosus]